MATAAGVYVSLSERERPKTGPVPGMSYATAPALKSFDDPRLARLDGESSLDFATRINLTLFEAFYHCDTNDAARVVDRLATYLLPREYRDQGFLDLKSARYGFCHQSAFMLSHALAAGGVDARPIGLIGHVVSPVKIGESAYLFDPDYGVSSIPYPDYSVSEVKFAYEQFGRWKGALEPVYASAKNDQPYYSMEWLDKVLTRQRTAVVLVETFVLLALSLATIIFCEALVRHFRKARRPA